MYPNLNSLGIEDIDGIEKYTVRTEGKHDVLKIYHERKKGEVFARSEKFKFPRQQKRVKVDGGTGEYSETSEISPNLRYVVEELDQITHAVAAEQDIKKKILADLRHLEKVVATKIAEIERDLERL